MLMEHLFTFGIFLHISVQMLRETPKDWTSLSFIVNSQHSWKTPLITAYEEKPKDKIPTVKTILLVLVRHILKLLCPVG